ncbi:MAG: hypothetical protein H6719_18695 [Sandaracinaceae bacterium]|nr:hypothetical protein [Sandaracinaceae bacterium]
MRAFLPFAIAACFGCGAAPAPSVAAVDAADAAPADAPIELRITLPTALVEYDRTQTITIEDLGGHHVRLEGRSRMQLRRQGQDEGYSVLRYLLYEPIDYRTDGQTQSPGPEMAGLEQQQVRSFVDPRGRLVEGPELTGAPQRRQLSAAVLALSRLIEPMYPPEPVRVGESWSEPTVLWNTPPIELAVVEIDRTWTLLAVEGEGADRRARIGWDVRMRVRPFEISGVSISGRGRLEGFSVVALADGVRGHAALDLTFEAGPAGAEDVIPLFRLEAKLADRIEPAAASSGGELIQSVGFARSVD